MPKTPDEIKKGLYSPDETMQILQNGTGIIHSQDKLYRSALAYIQQLEEDRHSLCCGMQAMKNYARGLEVKNAEQAVKIQQLEERYKHLNQLRDAAAGRALKMEERVHQLEAERDELMVFVKGQCHACKFRDYSFMEEPCDSCFADLRSRWEWRGVQKEDSDA